MKETQKYTYKELSLYQDDLLQEEKQSQIEEALLSNDEMQKSMDRLGDLTYGLENLGQRERLRAQVKNALKTQPHPLEKKSDTFFPSFTRLVFTGGTAVFACGLILWMFFLYPSHQFTLLNHAGEIHTQNASAGKIGQGDLITSGKESYAEIRMADGSSIVEIGPNSKLSLTGKRRLRIENGVVYNNVAKDPDSAFQVQTPHGIITVLGTVFEVQVDTQQTIVRVLKGKVQIQPNVKTLTASIIQNGQELVLKQKTLSKPVNFLPKSFAPWRNKFQSRNLDITNIADVISN